MDLEVLLEFRGSRLPVSVTYETALSVLMEAAKVNICKPGSMPPESDAELYFLQRFSEKWSTFVDIKCVNELKDGDRVTLSLKVGV